MQTFSDEFLNSFIDDQLAPEEKSRLYFALSQDETLSRRVCELRKLRDLVGMAYRDVEPPHSSHASLSNRHYKLGMAAGLLLLVCSIAIVMGWWPIAPLIHPNNPSVNATALTNETPLKILVHVGDNTPTRTQQTLKEIEDLLRLYRETHQVVRVEVIANGDGLGLLRRDVSSNPDRVRRLQQEYDNLTFIACQNTIDRLKRDRGIVAQLLPGVVVIDSAVAQITRRQQQGWAYIQG